MHAHRRTASLKQSIAILCTAIGVLWLLLAGLCWLWPAPAVRVLLALITGTALLAAFGWYGIASWAWHRGRGGFAQVGLPAAVFGLMWLLCLVAAAVSGGAGRGTGGEPGSPGASPPGVGKVFDAGPFKYLSDLPEYDKRQGTRPFTKNGLSGDGGQVILVNGYTSPKGLGMHPPDNGEVFVKYRLYKEAAVFKARAALDDSARQPGSAVLFEVLGDGKSLWRSEPLGRGGETQECRVDVTGVDVLELRVRAVGSARDLHAAWLDPRVLRSAETPDTPPPFVLFADGPREFLSDLPEFDVKLGPVPFAKNGDFGGDSKNRQMSVGGVRSPHGLGMHPHASSYAAVRYRLNKQAARFRAKTALNDGCSFVIGSCHFEVLGDGRILWTSKTVKLEKDIDVCDIDVSGVDVLELRVVDTDIVNTGLWAVWFEPRVLQNADAPDELAK